MKQICKVAFSLSTIMLLASFQLKDKSFLIGKWQATSIYAPSQDSVIAGQMKMQFEQIDEMTEIDSSLIKAFGTSDLITIKKLAKEEVAKQSEQMKQQVKNAVADFSFKLMDDRKVVFFSKDGNDTATWRLDDNGKDIIIELLDHKSSNSKNYSKERVFNILYASHDSLRLHMSSYGTGIFVDLIRSENKIRK